MHEKKLKILLVLILFFRVGFSIFLVLNVIKKKRENLKIIIIYKRSENGKTMVPWFFLKKKGKKRGEDEFLEQYLFKIACFLSRNGSKHQLPSNFLLEKS